MSTIISISNAILSSSITGGTTPIPLASYVLAENGDFLITEAGDNIIIE
jgi:hypothetical protein